MVQIVVKPLQRESNIELLRLVVMGMIVLHHFIFHGLGLYRFLQFDEVAIMDVADTRYALVADSFLICGVNVFVLISGWFSIKFKARSFVKLFAICSFFAILGYAIYLIISGLNGWGYMAIALRFVKRAIFVISSKTWWFIQLYFILMFLSNPINKYIEVASRKSLLLTILVFLFLNVYLGWIRGVEFVKDGYNLFNFIMLYLIGRYLKLYWKNDYTAYKDLMLFLVASVATAATALMLDKIGGNVYMALSYNSPFVIIGAIALLLLFTKMHFTSTIINYLAASSLAIYLFQEGVFNAYRYIKQMYIDGVGIGYFIMMITLFFILSMLVPIGVDKIRLLLFGHLEEKTAKLIDEIVLKRYIENGK